MLDYNIKLLRITSNIHTQKDSISYMSYTVNKYSKSRKNKINKLSYKSTIYFIRNQVNGSIKIGYSDDVDQRLLALQASNSDLLKIEKLLEVPKGRKKFWESMIHEAFKEYKIHGEWFQIPDQAFNQVYSVYSNLLKRYS
jgi:hypothetical protein